MGLPTPHLSPHPYGHHSVCMCPLIPSLLCALLSLSLHASPISASPSLFPLPSLPPLPASVSPLPTSLSPGLCSVGPCGSAACPLPWLSAEASTTSPLRYSTSLGVPLSLLLNQRSPALPSPWEIGLLRNESALWACKLRLQLRLEAGRGGGSGGAGGVGGQEEANQSIFFLLPRIVLGRLDGNQK